MITASKRHPLKIICPILKISKNEKRPYICLRVDKDGALENSTYVANLLVDKFIIVMKTTGDDASKINGKNELHNRIKIKVISGLLDSNQHENKWCCAEETLAELYR